MTPVIALHSIIRPAMRLLYPKFESRAAEVMLLAIGLQESKFRHRRQINGPAHGFWQFELSGGVKGVLEHHSTRVLAKQLCADLLYEAEAWKVYDILTDNDLLAAGFARLLLYTDPKPLPTEHDQAGAWDYYLRNWRPGRPHPETWSANHKIARETF